MPIIERRLASRVLGIALLLLSIQALVRAHDVPEEVVLQAYIKPVQSQLHVLLRVPLLAITDTNLPKDSVGYLAMPYLDPALGEAANQIASGIVFLENKERLSQFQMASARISLPSDHSFDGYDAAIAHVRGPRLPDSTQLYYNQGYLDLELLYPAGSQNSEFAIQVLLGKGVANRTVTLVNFTRPDGRSHAFRLLDQTDIVLLDPSWRQAAWVFLSTGFFRFLDGLDHLLFIILLVLPCRRLRDLLIVIASFAVAHTLTLTAAAFGLMPSGSWFPVLISMLIAFSIVYVAVEDAVAPQLRQRGKVAFGFGLVHGFGFALALSSSLQFAGGHPIAALLSFTLGLELGQAIILAIVFPAATLLFAHAVSERAGTIVLSLLAGHVAWHWMAEQWTTLQLMDTPPLDAALAAIVVRWLLFLTIVGGSAWFLTGLLRRKPVEGELPESR